jgi:hypothetical protein
MKKIIAIFAVAMFFVGCTENPASPTDGTYCYEKKIGYADVTGPIYGQYYKQWISKNCEYTINGHCGKIIDENKVITIQECAPATYIPN